MSKVKNITIKKDDKDIELQVVYPSSKIQSIAQLAYNSKFRELVQPKDGSDGALVRAVITDVAKKQGLWSDEKEKEVQEIQKKISQNILKWKAGGIKQSEGRRLALEVKKLRQEINSILAGRNSLDQHTAEAQAEQARFEHIISSCVKHADNGQLFFSSPEEFAKLNNSNDEATLECAQAMYEVFYDIPEDFEKKLPENIFLRENNMCDDDLNLVRKDGKIVDEDGKLIDKEGRYIDEEGNFVDDMGNRVDEEGNFIVEKQPLIEDDWFAAAQT